MKIITVMSAREQFIAGVCNQMKEVWESTTSIDEKWNVLKSAMCNNTVMILSEVSRR